MDLRELGQSLRERREAQNLTLDEVSQRTKISRRNLAAIEDGNRDDLPHAVYTKGFIRNYAKLVGLEGKELDKTLALTFPSEDDFSDEAAKELKKDIKLHAATRSGTKGKGVLLSVVAVLVLLGVLAVLVWYLPRQAPRQAESGKAVSAPAPLAEPETIEDEAETAEVPPPPVTPDEVKTVEEVSEPPSGPVAQEPPVQEAEPAVDKYLLIEAIEPCWLEVFEDGQRTEYTLQAGERLRLTFSDALKVRFGNAGGVLLEYNGREMPVDAESGQVRTMTFPPGAGGE